MARILALVLTIALGPVACGDTGGGGNSDTVEVTASSFDCILDGTKVRKFYIKNLLDDLAASVAVAEGDAPVPYPPGTLIQLFPLEAMVKREAGFSEETNDWEFFFLAVNDQGTEIVTRGKDEAENAFGGNCFSCHSGAVINDFVCETGNGCDPLADIITDELITTLQETDPRCR